VKKIGKMGEMAWLVGTVLCAFGVVLCTKANLGLSMMAAPPYIIHVAASKIFPWYTQGTSEYIFQTLLMILMWALVGRFRIKYLLAFATAVFYGFVVDGWLALLGGSGSFGGLPLRVAGFCVGVLCISLSVAVVFRSYLPPQIAECFVMELSTHFKADQSKVKMINDISFLVLSFSLSLLLTGGFTGVGVGTVVVSFVNAPLILLWGKLMDRYISFDPILPKWKEWMDKH